VNAQTMMHKRMASIDRVKNGLLIAVILYALAIAGMAIYNAWNNPGA
jgi:hypothetical protein